jgi:murein DD-endopeptidase MepM/ murein hydrolase activator NlpD
MARDSIRVKPGQTVEAGTPLGRVGLSGKTEFPHLHFGVRRRDQTIDPFAYGLGEGMCKGGRSLWNSAVGAKLTYREREVINSGLAAGLVTMEQVESGEIPLPQRDSPALVAYVRAIGLKAGDELELELIAPDGSVLFHDRRQPLDRAKAQFLVLGGRKGHGTAWPSGTYTVKYKVQHQNEEVLNKTFMFTLR